MMKKFFSLASKNKLLILIILVGLFLRLWGVYPGFPPYHPDEPQVYERAVLILLGKEEKLGYYGYPALAPLLHAVVYALFFIPIGIMKNLDILLSTGMDFYEFLQKFVIGSREINALYWGRYTNAILGTGSILLVYLVGKGYFNRIVGLLAATFLAFNYRHVLASHFALVDVPNDLFLLLTLFVALKILNKGSAKDYMISGLVAALSASVKFSPFGLVPLAIAHLLKHRKTAKLSFWNKPLYLLIVFVLTFILINHFHFLHLEETLHDFEILYKRYAAGTFEFMSYPYIYLYNWGITPLISAFTVLGILWSFKKNLGRALMLFLPVFLFFFSLTFYSSGGLYIRNFVTIIPVLLIFAGVGAYVLFQFIRSKALFIPQFINWRGLFFTLIILSLLTSARNSFTASTAYARPWNLTNVVDFFSRDLGQVKIAGTAWFLNHVFSDRPGVTKIDLALETNFSLPELQDAGAEYLLLDTDLSAPALVWALDGKLWKPGIFFKMPVELMSGSFVGSVFRELLAFRQEEFVKPWQAPETNFFFIKLPDKPEFHRAALVYEEDFDGESNWISKSAPSSGKPPNLQPISDTKRCMGAGCVLIDGKSGGSQFLRYTSQPIALEEGYLYRVSAKIASGFNLSKDGFLKAELFKDRGTAESQEPSDIVFVSARYLGTGKWEEKEIFVDVPSGYRFMTISFQVDKREETTFYFDNVVVEKGQKYSLPPRKDFPEDIIFTNSIL